MALRSGPGDSYDSIRTLPYGTTLDVERLVHNKADWIKVAVNPGTAEHVEGYVNIASGLIKVNADLGDVPPIYEYGPGLLEPIRFANYAVEDNITFKWKDYVVLEEHQYYSIILVHDDLSDEKACYHWQTKETEVSFRPKDHNCTAGGYHWGVSIATDLSGGERTDWRRDSEFNERNPIGIGMPHPDTPTGDEQDPGELPPDY